MNFTNNKANFETAVTMFNTIKSNIKVLSNGSRYVKFHNHNNEKFGITESFRLGNIELKLNNDTYSNYQSVSVINTDTNFQFVLSMDSDYTVKAYRKSKSGIGREITLQKFFKELSNAHIKMLDKIQRINERKDELNASAITL